jgi:hypothetical protein
MSVWANIKGLKAMIRFKKGHVCSKIKTNNIKEKE